MASTLPSQTPFAHIPLDVCIQIAKPMLKNEDEKKVELESDTSKEGKQTTQLIESSSDSGSKQVKNQESIEQLKDPLSIHPLTVRLALLQKLNSIVSSIFETLPLDTLSSSLSFMEILKSFRSLLFLEIKKQIWEDQLSKFSSMSEMTPNVTVNRIIRSTGTIIRNSVFVQVMEQLRPYCHGMLRSPRQAFQVQYEGEGSIDAGGPYRDCLSDMADELLQIRTDEEQSSFTQSKENSDGQQNQGQQNQGNVISNIKIGKSCLLPLLRPSPNHYDNVGSDRECFILNTSNDEQEWRRGTQTSMNKWMMNVGNNSNDHSNTAKSGILNQRKIEMLRYLGSLMSIHIFTHNPMNIMLAKLVWRHIVDEQPTIDDLQAVDENFVRSMRKIRECNNKPEFASYGVEWTVVASDGRVVDLSSHRPIHIKDKTTNQSKTKHDEKKSDIYEDDNDLAVSFEDRHAYCTAAEQFHLHEGAAEAAEVRQGLLQNIPREILLLATGPELEFLVCGEPTISVDDLRRIIVLSGFEQQRGLQKMFWEMLERMTNKQRQLFLRFATGRSRMPHLPSGSSSSSSSSSSSNSMPLSVHPMSMRNSKAECDRILPASHTCNQSLELPPYSSTDVMYERFVYAITNCVSIDTDFTNRGFREQQAEPEEEEEGDNERDNPSSDDDEEELN